MNRRDLLFLDFNNKLNDLETQRSRANIDSTLAMYSGGLNQDDIIHLLRRSTFNVTPNIVNYYSQFSKIEDVVNAILGDGLDHLPANSGRLPDGHSSLNWLDDPQPNPMTQPQVVKEVIEGTHNGRFSELLNWWLGVAKSEDLSKNPARERITFFWHTHWCIQFKYDTEAYIPPPLLYRNLDKLRKYRISNFMDMVKQMTLDGAYLLYQSLNQSTASAPNENYMRELMELFTMGIGNYSEGDIREGARALTGWRVTAHLGDRKPAEYFDSYFSPQDHDITAKTLMGNGIAARDQADNVEDKVKNEELYKVIEILFTRKPNEIATFICRKIYKYFVYSNPAATDETFIGELAKLLVASNFELRPVFYSLFTSTHFFDPLNRGVQIKQPMDFLINFQNTLGVNYSNSNGAMNDLEQSLYMPPNVSGWTGYRNWISTKTFPSRITHAKSILALKGDNDLIDFANAILGVDRDLVSLVKALTSYFLPIQADDNRVNSYFIPNSNIPSGADTQLSNWLNVKDPKAAQTIRGIITRIIYTPDFQLS